MNKRAYRIDKIREIDSDRVIDILHSLPEWFTPEAVTEVRNAIRRLPGFVVRVGDVVRGFVLLEEKECCIEIAWLAVEKGFHGEGIGTMLVKATEAYACSKGKPVLTVKTYGGMDYEPYLETLAFYKKRGFKEYELIEDYRPFGGQPAIILVENLGC